MQIISKRTEMFLWIFVFVLIGESNQAPWIEPYPQPNQWSPNDPCGSYQRPWIQMNPMDVMPDYANGEPPCPFPSQELNQPQDWNQPRDWNQPQQWIPPQNWNPPQEWNQPPSPNGNQIWNPELPGPMLPQPYDCCMDWEPQPPCFCPPGQGEMGPDWPNSLYPGANYPGPGQSGDSSYYPNPPYPNIPPVWPSNPGTSYPEIPPVSPDLPGNPGCPTRIPGWIRIDLKEYYLPEIHPTTWMQAEALSLEKGGKLVEPDSDRETEKLQRVLQKCYPAGSRFWVGANNLVGSNQWRWASDGKPINYFNWAEEGPVVEAIGKCAEFQLPSLQWRKSVCSDQDDTLGYLVERRVQFNPPITPPPTQPPVVETKPTMGPIVPTVPTVATVPSVPNVPTGRPTMRPKTTPLMGTAPPPV